MTSRTLPLTRTWCRKIGEESTVPGRRKVRRRSVCALAGVMPVAGVNALARREVSPNTGQSWAVFADAAGPERDLTGVWDAPLLQPARPSTDATARRRRMEPRVAGDLDSS